MAITRVGTSQFSEASGVATRALTVTPGAIGNLLVVGASVGDANAGSNLTIADTALNTWVPVHAVRLDNVTANITSASWYALANGTSATTVTVTSAHTQFMIMSLEEFTGVASSLPADQAVRSADGASGTPTSPSFTPSANDELVWCWCADSLTAVGNIDGSTATAGANGPTYSGGDGTQFRVLVGRSGVAMTATMTGSGIYTVMVATFKPATSANVAIDIGAGALVHHALNYDKFKIKPGAAKVVIGR